MNTSIVPYFNDQSVSPSGYHIFYYDENGLEITKEEYHGSTAEEWLQLEGYGGTRPTTLLYLKLKLDSVGKQSQKLNAVQQWMDTMILGSVAHPDVKSFEWVKAPYSFFETTQEILSVLKQ